MNVMSQCILPTLICICSVCMIVSTVTFLSYCNNLTTILACTISMQWGLVLWLVLSMVWNELKLLNGVLLLVWMHCSGSAISWRGHHSWPNATLLLSRTILCLNKNAPNLARCGFDKHRLSLILFGKQHEHTFLVPLLYLLQKWRGAVVTRHL